MQVGGFLDRYERNVMGWAGRLVGDSSISKYIAGYVGKIDNFEDMRDCARTVIVIIMLKLNSKV